eukprot:scaffold178485_cov38-Prasinocladus_malaysianus.AAC.1
MVGPMIAMATATTTMTGMGADAADTATMALARPSSPQRSSLVCCTLLSTLPGMVVSGAGAMVEAGDITAGGTQ